MNNLVKNYCELGKVRLTVLVLVTAYLGYYLGLRSLGNTMMTFESWLGLFHLLIGVFLTSVGSGALNQYIERNLDSKMDRTKNRPIPSGRITSKSAFIFGVLTIFIGAIYLSIFTNYLTAFLSIATVVLYLFIYTPSKRKTTLNTIIGSIPGALPPVGGWAASTGIIDTPAWILFGIMFFWQIPHFLSLAIIYASDYNKGGFKMLPSVYPNSKLTQYMIVFFSVAMVGTTLGLFIIQTAGIVYAAGVSVIGFLFLILAFNIMWNTNTYSVKRLFFATIVYLPVLLFFIFLD